MPTKAPSHADSSELSIAHGGLTFTGTPPFYLQKMPSFPHLTAKTATFAVRVPLILEFLAAPPLFSFLSKNLTNRLPLSSKTLLHRHHRRRESKRLLPANSSSNPKMDFQTARAPPLRPQRARLYSGSSTTIVTRFPIERKDPCMFRTRLSEGVPHSLLGSEFDMDDSRDESSGEWMDLGRPFGEYERDDDNASDDDTDDASFEAGGQRISFFPQCPGSSTLFVTATAAVPSTEAGFGIPSYANDGKNGNFTKVHPMFSLSNKSGSSLYMSPPLQTPGFVLPLFSTVEDITDAEIVNSPPATQTQDFFPSNTLEEKQQPKPKRRLSLKTANPFSITRSRKRAKTVTSQTQDADDATTISDDWIFTDIATIPAYLPSDIMEYRKQSKQRPLFLGVAIANAKATSKRTISKFKQRYGSLGTTGTGGSGSGYRPTNCVAVGVM